MADEITDTGEIYKVSGPVVVAEDLDAQMYDVVKVGEEGLMGEVIEIEGEKTSIQVYEDTTGIRPGEPVKNTGSPLSVELGPGMLSSIYDGLQRPLPALEEQTGSFIARGEDAPGVARDEEWEFEAHVEEGDDVSKGDVLGVVEEKGKAHRILVPPDREGTIDTIEEGAFTVDETVATLEDGTELQLMHEWPIREAREVTEK
ncbi:MAG: V-type ATP synthase subunit A, partial [Candidatus Nanohaloarchaea archaeon]|nr:V-type ATP synthase subunit A [Candidatus Nanohaloarchaea archaeon]